VKAKNAKNPHSLVFWNDLENDDKLNACGWAARGLWACKLLPIASRSVAYGVVIIGDHPCRWNADLPVLLARAAGAADPEAVKVVAATFLALLTELVTSGAASVDNMGRLFNRRMVREAKVSAERSRAGRQGALATNASRQTSRQTVGKGVGNGVGNDVGKDLGNAVGKTSATGSEVNADSTTTIPIKPPPDVRQNVGKEPDTVDGKSDGKSSPSSSFSPNGDSMRGKPLQSLPPEDTPSPVAARESAAGAPHTTRRPRIAERMAALIDERQKSRATT
jgi:hypothetical protein